MSISALFGTNPSRENRSVYSSQSGSSNTSFASQLDAATSEVEQARDSTVVKLSAASSAMSSGAASSADATSATASGSATESLGADAQANATLAGDGVTIGYQSIDGVRLLPGADPSGATGASQSTTSSTSDNDTLTESAMESLAAQFGGSKAEADQLFSLLGGTANGTVSNTQMLNALSQTSGDSGSQLSQMLMGLMDTNGNHVVSGSEFTQFETAMVNTEHNSAA